nr:hypothetical protein [Thiorhodococcus mannitoliphagus]
MIVHVGTDDNHEITMTFLQGNLVDANDLQRLERAPIDLRLKAPIQDALQRIDIDTDALLAALIFERTVDQLQQHLILERLRHRGAGRRPRQRLARRRMPVAVVALVPLGAQDNHNGVFTQGHMAQRNLLTQPVSMMNALSAAMTVRALQGAMKIDLERPGPREHNPINRDIGEAQQRLQGFWGKRHNQQRSNEHSSGRDSQPTDS